MNTGRRTAPAPAPVPDEALWALARREVGDGRLTLLMPAFNLHDVIGENVRRVRALFAGRLPFEIVVIDDGSRDGTGDAIESLSPAVPELRVVRLARNSGKGAALREGFEKSRGTHVALLDADLDLAPEQTLALFRVMAERGADVVIGSKRHPDSVVNYPWHRRLMSAIYFWTVKLLFGLPIHDTQTGLKLFKRPVLEWVFPRMLVKAFAFDLEILAIAHDRGYRIAEGPVRVDFHAAWGCARPATIGAIVKDTLAVFYRLRILRYYASIPDVRMPDPPPRVSVVIAFPAVTPYLEETLAGLAKQTCPPAEVILLPDAPSGRTWPAPVREMPTGRIRPAQKRNLAIPVARGEIVAFLDDDAFPAEDWLERAVVHFSDPGVGAVGGPACTPPSDPYLAQLSGRVYASALVSGSARCRYRPDRVREVDDFPSCNLLVRTGLLREAGGFRAEFWPGEDTYLCMELTHRLGRRIRYEPRSLVYHHRRRLFLPHLRQIGRYALHRGYFARRFPATSRRVAYMMPSLFVAGVAAGGALAAGLPWVRPFYFGALAVYALATAAAAADRRPLTWLLTWLGIVATHVVYGVRFVAGLLARRLPSQVERFDHPSEAPAP